MFRLLLVVLISLWGVLQVFIGLDVPSSKSIHYKMMNNYGMQAVNMNQNSVLLGASANMRNGYGGSINAGSINAGFVNAGSSNAVENSKVTIFVNSDVRAHSSLLRTTKNTPVFSAATLEEISIQNLSVKQYANLNTSDVKIANTTQAPSLSTTTSTANIDTLRHLANLEKLSSKPVVLPNVISATTLPPSASIKTSSLEPKAFGFGVKAHSLIGKLEAAKEVVEQELALSEENAKVHTNIALQLPIAPKHSSSIQKESETNFAIEQKQSLVFEAQATQAATGGLAGERTKAINSQTGFEVAVASVASFTPMTSTSIQPTNRQQQIASNLTDTSTTVVSGLEITLNPNAAVRRQTPAEQQAFLWPLPTRGRLTSGYGNRVLAITNNHFHQGIDIAVKTGTPILAVKDGVVEKAGWEGSYGYAVYVRHNDGTESRYAHMSRIIVEDGEWVNQGQWLGLVGSTGLSTGPHLHFELHLRGQAVDPSKHLVFSGERLASR